MYIQPHGLLQRLIRESMRPFARRHGFRFVQRTLLGKEHADTLHIIYFDVINPGFNCGFAVQPLYVPATHIALNLGRRLGHGGAQVRGRWGLGDTEDDVRRDLAQVERLLEADALPWLAEVGSPAGIVSFIETMARKRMPIWGLTAFWHHLYLGFSYLYVGRYDAAQKALAAAADTLSGDARPSAIRDRELVERMRVLARDEPDRVPSTLQESATETKANIGLK